MQLLACTCSAAVHTTECMERLQACKSCKGLGCSMAPTRVMSVKVTPSEQTTRQPAGGPAHELRAGVMMLQGSNWNSPPEPSEGTRPAPAAAPLPAMPARRRIDSSFGTSASSTCCAKLPSVLGAGAGAPCCVCTAPVHLSLVASWDNCTSLCAQGGLFTGHQAVLHAAFRSSISVFGCANF